MSECKTPYQVLAELIYAEHPDFKEALNIGAKLAIETISESMESNPTNADLEKIMALVAHIVGDLLVTPANNLSDKLNLFFDTYTLAAGAVAGEIDLGDTSAAKDMERIMKEAEAHAQEHAEHAKQNEPEVPGQYL